MTTGSFVRQESRFRGRPQGGPERHHLYVALACPWSQRAALVRAVTGLEIGISYAHPYRDERGWAFTGDRYTDTVNDFAFLAEAYEATKPGYDGRVSVPVLWDKQEGQIVSNESADIVEIFDAWTGGRYAGDKALRDEVDGWIYDEFQNGVYRAGFSRSQQAYDEAFRGVFAALERMEGILSEKRYLTGEEITLSDWRVLPTLLRFDAVYHTHFRCNGARLIEYPSLLRYTRDLFHQPHVAETFALDEIKEHYYTTHDELNPKRIIPAGRSTLGSPPERTLHLALELALLDRLTLVDGVLAAGQSDLDLGVAAAEVQARGDQGQALLLLLADQPLDLAPVHEQLARALGLVVLARGGRVGRDVDVVQPHLAVLDRGVAVLEHRLALAQGLDLGPGEHDPALPPVEQVVAERGWAIGGDVGHEPLTLR